MVVSLNFVTLRGFCLLFLVVLLACQCVAVKKDRDTSPAVVRQWPLTDVPECKLLRTCPKPTSKRWERLNERCCRQGGLFHCQEGPIGNEGCTFFLRFSCMTPVVCPPGRYLELRTLRLFFMATQTACRVCPPGEFQPQAKPSHHFVRPGCKRRKTCISLNAIALKMGSSTTDEICKCNHWEGYRPVPYTNKCFQFESLSGCKCVRDPCPEGQLISPKDFKCFDRSDPQAVMLAFGEQRLSNVDNYLNGWLEQYEETEREKLAMQTLLHSGVDICRDDSEQLQNPPSFWMFFLDTLVVRPHSDEFLILVFCFVAVLAPVFLCLRFGTRLMRQRSKKVMRLRRKMLVHFALPTKRTAEVVYNELGNILPVLAHHYGPLKLTANLKTRDVSVLVDPKKCKSEFQILHFIRDLLSPENIKKELARQGRRVDASVSYPNCPRKHTSTTTNIATPKAVSLKNNSGELILSFDNDDTKNGAILSQLNTCKEEIREVLKEFDLELRSIERGSIVITFHLAHGSKTFDSVTLDGQTNRITERLLSSTSFRRFRQETHALNVQFMAKGNLEHATAVYADRLYVQIGERNNVYTCDCAHIPLYAEQPADRSILQSEATGERACVANMIKLNILSLSPVPKDNAPAETDNFSETVRISVTSPDANVMKILREEWFNVKTLLQYRYPGCSQKHAGKAIIWELPAPVGKDPDTESFLRDIFAIERIISAIPNKPIAVDIHIPEWLAEMSVTRRFKKNFLKLCLRFKLDGALMHAMKSISVKILCYPFCTRNRCMCSCTAIICIVMCASLYFTDKS